MNTTVTIFGLKSLTLVGTMAAHTTNLTTMMMTTQRRSANAGRKRRRSVKRSVGSNRAMVARTLTTMTTGTSAGPRNTVVERMTTKTIVMEAVTNTIQAGTVVSIKLKD